VSLELYTARVSYSGPDRIDVTRKGGSVFGPSWDLLFAGRDGEITWDEYVLRYTGEMRRSWKRHRKHWLELLNRQRAVLCCYCTDSTRCHRVVLAGLVVAAGEARGVEVVYGGEISVARRQTA